MKKASLNMLSALTAIFIANTSFAAELSSVTIEKSIPDALQARTSILANHSNNKLAGAVGIDTYIIVINYTQETIRASFPTQQIDLTRLTAGRYQRANYTGMSYIELSNAYGARFWTGSVGYQDIISVYVSNGQFVVYDTH